MYSALWILVGVLGIGGGALLAYGLVRSQGPRNLANPLPHQKAQRMAGPRYTVKEPSVQRKQAEAKNEVRRTDCKDRYEDCTMACLAFPKKSEGYEKCMTFCTRSRSSCLEWANR